jgi:hypothetical protein
MYKLIVIVLLLVILQNNLNIFCTAYATVLGNYYFQQYSLNI